MATIRVLASGETPKAQANARGKLFEKLVAEILRRYGYSIDAFPSVNYSGMEIDIEGHLLSTGSPLYAECKCFETPVDAPKLQAFFGKYMGRWLKNKSSHGLFVALPRINSHAKGYYSDNIATNTEISCKLLQEKDVLDALVANNQISRQDVISHQISSDKGSRVPTA